MWLVPRKMLISIYLLTQNFSHSTCDDSKITDCMCQNGKRSGFKSMSGSPYCYIFEKMDKVLTMFEQNNMCIDRHHYNHSLPLLKNMKLNQDFSVLAKGKEPITIGLEYNNKTLDWVWIDSDPSSFSNWAPNNPGKNPHSILIDKNGKWYGDTKVSSTNKPSYYACQCERSKAAPVTPEVIFGPDKDHSSTMLVLICLLIVGCICIAFGIYLALLHDKNKQKKQQDGIATDTNNSNKWNPRGRWSYGESSLGSLDADSFHSVVTNASEISCGKFSGIVSSQGPPDSSQVPSETSQVISNSPQGSDPKTVPQTPPLGAKTQVFGNTTQYRKQTVLGKHDNPTSLNEVF